MLPCTPRNPEGPLPGPEPLPEPEPLPRPEPPGLPPEEPQFPRPGEPVP
jgi:hypothetical protein